MNKRVRWTARFYRWFVSLPSRKQESVLKKLDQGFEPVWDADKQSYRLRRPVKPTAKE